MYQVHVSHLMEGDTEVSYWSKPVPVFAKKHESEKLAHAEAEGYVKSFDPTKSEYEWDITNRWWVIRIAHPNDMFELMRVTVEEV